MNISRIKNVGFKAECIGEYANLKRISIDNGLPIENVDVLENKIQKLFPDKNQILKFYSLGDFSAPHRVGVQLIRNGSKKVMASVERYILPKDIKYYNSDEARCMKIDVFPKVCVLVQKLKNELKNMQTEQLGKNKKKKCKTPQNTDSTDFFNMKCIISPDLERIKTTSISAGYPQEQAKKIEAKLKEALNSPKFNGKKLHILLDEKWDSNGAHRFCLYHILRNIWEFPYLLDDTNKSIANCDYISKGYTQKDRMYLLEKTYDLIKAKYLN